MHRLANGTGVNARSIQEYSQSLHVVIRLAVCQSTFTGKQQSTAASNSILIVVYRFKQHALLTPFLNPQLSNNSIGFGPIIITNMQ
jgi:hypothetical protein